MLLVSEMIWNVEDNFTLLCIVVLKKLSLCSRLAIHAPNVSYYFFFSVSQVAGQLSLAHVGLCFQ